MRWLEFGLVLALGLGVGAGAAKAQQQRIDIELMVSHVSSEAGDIDPRGQKLHQKLQSQFRYYQERDLGLDLYHSGSAGLGLAVLAIASALVFLLAIFHVIPVRRHVVTLLLGLGATALLLGWGTTYIHFLQLEEVAPQLIRETAGPAPATEGQIAAVISLP